MSNVVVTALSREEETALAVQLHAVEIRKMWRYAVISPIEGTQCFHIWSVACDRHVALNLAAGCSEPLPDGLQLVALTLGTYFHAQVCTTCVRHFTIEEEGQ